MSRRILYGIGGLVIFLVVVVSLSNSETPHITTPEYSTVASASSTPEILPSTSPTRTATPQPSKAAVAPTPNPATGLYAVVSVTDGDTFKVNINGTTETLRMIGIDTPETVDPRKPVQCFGIEASNKAKAFLTGKRVRLEADSVQGERDKYGRLLRYAYLEDGTFFNKFMIQEGYAYEYTYDTKYKYQTEFKTAQAQAQAAKRGLWADNACQAPIVTPIATAIPSATPTPSPAYIQSPSPTPTPQSGGGYSLPVCASSDCNCGDFSSQAHAQWFHDTYDPNDAHRLDADHDGIACESL